MDTTEPDGANALEFHAERSAIMQFDGGLKHYEADYYAAVATRRFVVRHHLTEPRTTEYKILIGWLTGDEPLALGEPGIEHHANGWEGADFKNNWR